MKLDQRTAVPGATKDAKRIGRGHGSGNGKTARKGHKGQKARAGHGMRPGFEGGQMPLQRRIPKRGFNNIFAKEVVSVNIGSLNCFEDGSEVTVNTLMEAGVLKKSGDALKILANGELTKKLTVRANAFSEAAKAKIEAAGGKAEVV